MKVVHTSWSGFCNGNHWAPASNYQLQAGQGIKLRPGRVGGIKQILTITHKQVSLVFSWEEKMKILLVIKTVLK